MKELKRINKLKEEISTYKIDIIPTNIESLLIETLAYDWIFESLLDDSVFNKTTIKLVNNKSEYIKNSYIKKDIELFIQKLEKNFKENIRKNSNFKSPSLNVLLLINHILHNWSEFFWNWSKKIKYNLDNKIESQEWVLDAICRLTYEILKEKPLIGYNFSKWLVLTNYLLNIIGLPWIIFSYKNKKRIYKNIDYFIDFKKEFLLTIEWNCHHLIQNKIDPVSIISIEDLKKKKNTSLVYIKPGSWWYWKDRKKYTFIKK